MENHFFNEDENLSRVARNIQQEQQRGMREICYLSNDSHNNNINNNTTQYYHISKFLKENQCIPSQDQPQLFIYPLSKTIDSESNGFNSGQYAEKKPSGISIIYQPSCLVSRCGEDVKEVIRSAKLKKDWYRQGWRLQFVENKSGVTVGQKAFIVLCALVLAVIITLLSTGTVLPLLQNVNPTSSPKRNTWFGVVMITGDFHITNERFRSSLADQQTEDFQILASKISLELDKLYAESILSEEYHSSVITMISPGPGTGSKRRSGIVVKCWLALRSIDKLYPEKVGTAFLGGLHHKHGNVWLGNFIVDIQSIGFESKVEQISWSEWSEWSDCKRLPDGKFMQMRNRSCILQSGLHLSRVDLCFLLDNTRNVDTIECKETINSPQNLSGIENLENIMHSVPTSNLQPVNANLSQSNILSDNSDSEMNKIRQYDLTTENGFTGRTTVSERSNFLEVTALPNRKEYKLVNVKKQPQINAQGQHVVYDFSKNERRQCGLCVEGEVCVALKDDTVPYCLSIIDPKDPTGCGGHCKINVEICQRLQKGIYRCVDDTQCLPDEWQCSNRLCIPLSKRCDGYFNCYDNTDEINCDCNLKTHFQCGKWLSCLPNEKRCDGIIDCWDAADEYNCTKDCFGSGQFPCNNSQCILTHQFCDGYPDCADRSDEPFGCGGDCKKNEFKCRNNRCIRKSNICNGKDDCGDNSDEQSCIDSR